MCWHLLLQGEGNSVRTINPTRVLAVTDLEEPGLPGLRVSLVGSRCGLHDGGQLYALYPWLRHLAVGDHAGNMERGQPQY